MFTLMYAKLFSSLLSSSIWSEELETRVIFMTLLAMADREGYVYGSPVGLAALARMPLDATIKALDKLKSPDNYSSDLKREEGRDGRRIKELSQGGWHIVNYTYYRDLADADVRRAQVRNAVRKHRKASVITANQSKSSVIPSESESYSESDTDAEKSKRERRNFVPPTLAEISEYRKEIPGLDAEAFFDFYTSKGWRVGSSPMKDWRAAARKWRRKDVEDGKVKPVSIEGMEHRTSEATKRDQEMAAALASIAEVERDRDEYQRLLAVDPAAAARFRDLVKAKLT